MVEFFELTFDNILIWVIALFGIGVYVLGIFRYRKANTKLKTDLLAEIVAKDDKRLTDSTTLLAQGVKEQADRVHQAIRDELAEVYEIAMNDVRKARKENLENQIQLRSVITSLAKQGIQITNGEDAAFERDIARRKADIEEDKKAPDGN